MKRLVILCALAASPAAAQVPVEGRLPAEAACVAVLERVQLALAQADRALQSEDYEEVDRWSSIAANYASVHAAFCGGEPEE